ncbi:MULTISPECIES: C45 family peptidase [unclassified Amycolatopsis]|uniref:C45 family autoproteolytic acyltransferase/hydolase n=1 Tax=unclassified Amycolatopsis TaxID=2618356 RepID=UPI001C69DAF2|nr:C45 family peptidase [Amycolatopsis sp. DSM 110486]QYN19142.1 C45 family peptidase [Amycolatopsis sp. DSM 110486]
MTGWDIPLIEISGGPRERGLAYGEAARPLIRASVDYYREGFHYSSALDWADVCERARAWRDPVAEVAPDLLTEIDAIAEGAGLRADEVFALNARGEIVRAHDSGFGPQEVDGCSSFALLAEATGDGHVYCGQNWDWRVGTARTVVMLRVVQPPKPTIIMQVEAGQIGRHGVNSAGIALNGNGLDGAFRTPLGLPQPFLRRMILDSAYLRDALRVPYDVHQHIATNLLFTARGGVAIDLETTPVTHRWGYPDNGILVHANHYQYGVPPEIAEGYRPSSVDSLYRVPVIERGLAGVRSAAGSDEVRATIRRTMSDHIGFPHAVCEHPDPRQPEVRHSMTMMSALADLTTGEYRVTGGNPCENEYTLLPWNINDGPGGDE